MLTVETFRRLPFLQNFTVDEFCALERISRSTFYREVQDGRLRTVRARGRTIITRAEVERRQAEREAAAVAGNGRLQ